MLCLAHFLFSHCCWCVQCPRTMCSAVKNQHSLSCGEWVGTLLVLWICVFCTLCCWVILVYALVHLKKNTTYVANMMEKSEVFCVPVYLICCWYDMCALILYWFEADQKERLWVWCFILHLEHSSLLNYTIQPMFREVALKSRSGIWKIH